MLKRLFTLMGCTGCCTALCLTACVAPTYTPTRADGTATLGDGYSLETSSRMYKVPEDGIKLKWYTLERMIPDSAVHLGIFTYFASTPRDGYRQLQKACAEKGANAVYQLPAYCYDRSCANQFLMLRVGRVGGS